MKKVLLAIALTMAMMAGSQGQALTFTLNTEFSGAQAPSGTPPWLTATFTQNGANTVRLTMTETNLNADEYVDEWLFNLNPAKDATALTFTYVSGIVGSISTVADNSSQIAADGGGRYDIKFDFPAGPPADRFDDGNTSVYDITLTDLLEADFNYVSATPAPNGQFHTAAHVQSIVGTNGSSGWIGDEDGGGPPAETVPEPGTIALVGLGLAALGLYHRKRRS